MEYRLLGRTGVKVSPLGLGSDDFGDATPPDVAAQIIVQAVDAGINLIDTGNLYAGGAFTTAGAKDGFCFFFDHIQAGKQAQQEDIQKHAPTAAQVIELRLQRVGGAERR